MNRPSLIPINISTSNFINDPLSKYVCSWIKDEKIRQDLVNRIKYKKQTNQPDYANKIINDQSLSEEYFKIWM